MCLKFIFIVVIKYYYLALIISHNIVQLAFEIYIVDQCRFLILYKALIRNENVGETNDPSQILYTRLIEIRVNNSYIQISTVNDCILLLLFFNNFYSWKVHIVNKNL